VLALLLAAEDPWVGPDKALHLGASYIAYSAARTLGAERGEAAGITLTLGVSKELWDLTGRGTPSWRDLLWDLAGLSLGVAAEHFLGK